MPKSKKTAAAQRKSPRSKPPAKTRRYHHGALRDALLNAADAILAERGVEGFTLREAARRAGVSPAAPSHHFASAAGLLTEIAIAGYDELARFLREARPAAESAGARLRATGLGYVRFALMFPGRFKLMHRPDLLADDPRLGAASAAAFDELEAAARAYAGDAEAGTLALACWSAAHGFAHLAIEGRFDRASGVQRVRSFAEDRMPDAFAVLFPDRA